jgi:hypothetical protein
LAQKSAIHSEQPLLGLQSERLLALLLELLLALTLLVLHLEQMSESQL